MKSLRWEMSGAILLVVLLLTLGGCYTQFGSSRDDTDMEYITGETDESAAVSDEEYYDAQEQFYNDSYYPGYSPLFGFGWLYPPFGGGAYPFSYPYGGYSHGHGSGWHGTAVGGGKTRTPLVTRRFGADRTLGGSRDPSPPSRGGYVPLPLGARQSGSGSAPAATPVRPGFSGGRRGTEAERRAPATAPSSRGHADQHPSKDTTPAPSRDSGGGVRSPERPAERPAPAPSQPAPSGGGRGNDTRGSGGSRGGERR
jgi:hypothetical protein